MTRILPICLLTLISLFGLNGCKNSSRDKNPTTFEKPATLPAAFEDSFGETWTCINAEEDNMLSGKVNFGGDIGTRNTDILHISLLELGEDGDIQLVATQCINNIQRQPIFYQLAYNDTLINPQARYVLSSVYFIRLEDKTYMAAYRPDGFLEVINNGVVSNADVILNVF